MSAGGDDGGDGDGDGIGFEGPAEDTDGDDEEWGAT